tara:strand:+ start:532 stop:669 length:138 start_codon:yes stop_codon:yes gene_type:complete
MKKTFPYAWKDLISNLGILSGILGIVLLILGSFPDFFDKSLPLYN